MRNYIACLIAALLLSIPNVTLADQDIPKAVEDLSKAKTNANANEATDFFTLQADDDFLGNKNAKVVVIEYSSTSCPHCAEFHKKTLPDIKKNYINNGKILYIYRDLPTNHPGLLGAMLSHCAGKDEYFNYISTLMESQGLWAYRKDYKESLINIAKLGGFNDEKIKACFENKQLETMIFKRAMLSSQKLDIRVTPVFFINGKKYEGAFTYPELSKILDDLLK